MTNPQFLKSFFTWPEIFFFTGESGLEGNRIKGELILLNIQHPKANWGLAQAVIQDSCVADVEIVSFLGRKGIAIEVPRQ